MSIKYWNIYILTFVDTTGSHIMETAPGTSNNIRMYGEATFELLTYYFPLTVQIQYNWFESKLAKRNHCIAGRKSLGKTPLECRKDHTGHKQQFGIMEVLRCYSQLHLSLTVILKMENDRREKHLKVQHAASEPTKRFQTPPTLAFSFCNFQLCNS